MRPLYCQKTCKLKTSAKVSVTHNIGILLGTRSLFSFISEVYVESHLQFVYIYLIIYHPL